VRNAEETSQPASRITVQMEFTQLFHEILPLI